MCKELLAETYESRWTRWWIFSDANAIGGLRALDYSNSSAVLQGQECDKDDISVFSYTKK